MATLALNERIDLTVRGPVPGPVSGFVARLGRQVRAFRRDCRLALVEAGEERRALRRERALRDLDLAQLRDIGFDRGAC